MSRRFIATPTRVAQTELFLVLLNPVKRPTKSKAIVPLSNTYRPQPLPSDRGVQRLWQIVRCDDVGDFFKHALLGIPTKEYAPRMRTLWEERWHTYRAQNTDPASRYQNPPPGELRGDDSRFVAVRVFVLAGLPVPLSLGGPVGPMFAPSVFFLVFGVVALRIFIRWNASRRIMNEIYAAARSAPA